MAVEADMQSYPNCGTFQSQASKSCCVPEETSRTQGYDGWADELRATQDPAYAQPQAVLGPQQREGTGLREPRKDLSLKVLLTEGPALPGCSASHQSSAGCWGIPSPHP